MGDSVLHAFRQLRTPARAQRRYSTASEYRQPFPIADQRRRVSISGPQSAHWSQSTDLLYLNQFPDRRVFLPREVKPLIFVARRNNSSASSSSATILKYRQECSDLDLGDCDKSARMVGRDPWSAGDPLVAHLVPVKPLILSRLQSLLESVIAPSHARPYRAISAGSQPYHSR